MPNTNEARSLSPGFGVTRFLLPFLHRHHNTPPHHPDLEHGMNGKPRPRQPIPLELHPRHQPPTGIGRVGPRAVVAQKPGSDPNFR